MRIGILETGRPPEGLEKAHGSYPDMFAALLAEQDPSFTFVTYAALDGEVPKDPHACDAWLITGSKHGVYDNLPWMADLKALIRAAFAARVPVAGICFGHQIMAEALGGRVQKSEKGWGLGLHTYALSADRPSWMRDGEDTMTIPAVHQDQVVALPEGARRVATSPFCENAAIAYDDIGFSVQGHPEFSEHYQRDLYPARANILPAAKVAEAVQSFAERQETRKTVAHWIAQFLAAHRTRKAA
jgi:GMP synthase-like glutamine amidotransferase